MASAVLDRATVKDAMKHLPASGNKQGMLLTYAKEKLGRSSLWPQAKPLVDEVCRLLVASGGRQITPRSVQSGMLAWIREQELTSSSETVWKGLLANSVP